MHQYRKINRQVYSHIVSLMTYTQSNGQHLNIKTPSKCTRIPVSSVFHEANKNLIMNYPATKKSARFINHTSFLFPYCFFSVVFRDINGSSQPRRCSASNEESGDRPTYTIKQIITMDISELVRTRIAVWNDNYVLRLWK